MGGLKIEGRCIFISEIQYEYVQVVTMLNRQ